MEDSLKKRYVIKLLANAITGILNIIIVSLVPKALGPTAFGYFSYLQQFFAQLIAFLEASTSIAFFTKLSARPERKELLLYYSLFSILLLLLIYFILYIIGFFDLYDFFLPDIPSEYVIYGAWFGFLTWLTQVFIKISDSYALTVSVEVVKILHKLFSLFLLIFIINYWSFGLDIYFYFHFFSFFSFLIIVTFLFIKKEILNREFYNLRIPYKDITSELIKYCSPLFVFNSITISVALFDIWLLQKVSGAIETGYYGIAYSIAAMCFLFTSAMTPIITREFSKYFELKDLETVTKLFKKYIPMLYAISAYFSIFIAFQSDALLEIFTDEKFKDAYWVLVVMAFYPIHQTYGQLSGSLFFATNTTKEYRNIGLLCTFLGVFLTYYLIYLMKYGALGFAFKMVLIQLLSVNIQLFFNTKQLGIKMKAFVFHQIYTVVIFIIIAYLSTLIYSFDNLIVDFLIQGIVYTLLTIIIFLVFPSIFSVSKNDLINLLKRKRI